MPGVLQGRQPRDRQLGPARPAARLRLPRPAAARQPLPHLPRRRRLRHPRQAGRHGHPGPGDRPADDHLHKPAAEPADRLQHALLRLRARASSRPRPSAAPTRSPRTFTPWDSSLGTQTSTQFFTLDSGPGGAPCPGPQRPFSPGFEAASAGNTAGAHTPFAVDLTRNDGDQNLSGLNVTTPPGFSATLAASPTARRRRSAAAASSSYSGLAELANPSCPAASQIGTAVAGAGAGTHPLYVPGKVYLAGPYKGAPLSLAVITPAVSGPMTSATSSSGPRSTSTPPTPRSPPSPIPCRRSSRASRCGCARSGSTSTGPTSPSTRPTATRSRSAPRSSGDEGGVAPARSSHFQVANCASLPFAPKLALQAHRRHQPARPPGAHAVLTASPGEANIARAAVTLP